MEQPGALSMALSIDIYTFLSCDPVFPIFYTELILAHFSSLPFCFWSYLTFAL